MKLHIFCLNTSYCALKQIRVFDKHFSVENTHVAVHRYTQSQIISIKNKHNQFECVTYTYTTVGESRFFFIVIFFLFGFSFFSQFLNGFILSIHPWGAKILFCAKCTHF